MARSRKDKMKAKAPTAVQKGTPSKSKELEKVVEPLQTEDMGKQKASTAEGSKEAALEPSQTEDKGKQQALAAEETALESAEDEDEESMESEDDTDEESLESMETEDDTDDEAPAGLWSNGLAAKLGNHGVILVLFGTPSGFAVFSYDGIKLLEPNACQSIWVDFTDHTVAKRTIFLEDFQAFEDKLSAINSTGVSDALANMIKKHIVPGQKLAVENEDYQKAIENSLEISCLYDPAVEELMWGLKIQTPYLVPAENSEQAKEDLFPMSEGMKSILNFHDFKFKPDMMVTRRIIELAGIVYECDRCVRHHDNSLRRGGEHLKEISRIDTQDWDSLKLATALKMICYPDEAVPVTPSLFSKQELRRMWKDKKKYESKIMRMPLKIVYNEIYRARDTRHKAARVLRRLLHQAAKAQESPGP